MDEEKGPLSTSSEEKKPVSSSPVPTEEIRERNRDAPLNLGLIAWGPLREIEKLQALIEKECKGLRIVYQTVTGSDLWLSKRRKMDNGNKREG